MKILTWKDIKTLLSAHYLVNILLCASFISLKTIYPICTFLFPNSNCELNWREWEILTFLAVIIVFRTRRSGATSMLAYLSSSFMYCKIANLILYLHSDPRMAICYGILCILQLLLVPEPAYSGPEYVTYFSGTNLWEEINSDKRVMWIIAFYAAWSPACVQFAQSFSRLSAQYNLDNLKFGKLDVARFPNIAKEFRINDSSFSKQLPTVILFKNGKESMRQPTVDSRGHLNKFFFSEDNMKAGFDLNNLYQECKNNPLKDRKKKVDVAAMEPIPEAGDGKQKAE